MSITAPVPAHAPRRVLADLLPGHSTMATLARIRG